MTPRRSDRLRSACRVDVSVVGAWHRPGRAPERCATPKTTPEPVFVTPDTPPEIVSERRLPNALLLANEDFRLTCQDMTDAGPYGDAVLIPAGTVERLVAWTDLTDLQADEMDHLARLSEADIQMVISPAQDATGMQQLTRLNQVQVVELMALLSAVRQEITQDTLAAAESAIRCVWRNAAQTARCSSPAAATDQTPGATLAGILNPVTVEFGRYDSALSQQDANQMALLEAQRRLVCQVANEQQHVTCQTIGYVDAVPNDPEGVEFGGRRRTGSVTIPAGAFFAQDQQQANQQAQAYGASLLDCFYVNEQQVARCQDLNPALATAWNNPVLLTDQQPGNPVTVPAGTVIVEAAGSSQVAANATALLEAQAYLSCRFRNTRQEVRCPPLELGPTTYPPSNPDAVYVVEAGSVEGGSQEEADQLARDLGLLQLGCTYCNAFIPPSCYPPDYTPSPGQAIPLSDVTSAWSPDVILGLAAGTICDQDPEQMIATSLAVAIVRPVVVDTGCQYLNDEMWFGCLIDLPGAARPPGGYHHPDYSGNTSLPQEYIGMPFDQQLSASSAPSPSLGAASKVVIQAGAYPVYSNEVPPGMSPKQYANQQARLFGLSTLRCVFGNPLMDLNCATAHAAGYNQEEVAKQDRQVTSVVIPAGRHESFFSFREAVEAAKEEAIGLLDCYYENPDILVRCWPGFSIDPAPELISGSGVVPMVYGTGQARRFWSVADQVYFEDRELQTWQPGSVASPVIVPRGLFRSNTSLQEAIQSAVRYGVASLDCTAQAQDNNVCNDPMLIYCGGVVERNPAVPYAPNEGQRTDKWTTTDGGVLKVGDGRNYVASRDNGVMNLGCAQDSVGGCLGSGLRVAACLVSAPTREEANLLAYNMMRGQLACWMESVPDFAIPGGGGGEGGGGDGSGAPQTGCEGKCLAVYS